MNARKLFDRLGLTACVLLLLSPAVFFILWMLSLSLKNDLQNAAYPPIFIPSPPTIDNFVKVFAQSNFLGYLINSIIVTGGATALALALGIPAGYGLAKLGAKRTALAILIARMTPALAYLIPLYILFRWLGLLGGLTPLVITHLVITLPFVIYVMMSFFEGLPKELDEAAVIDGASKWQIFWMIGLPLARSGVTVAATLSFIFSWNNFVFGIVLAGRASRTLPVAVYNMLSFEETSWGPLAAAGLVVMAPILILTVLLQKQIIAGMTSGAVK